MGKCYLCGQLKREGTELKQYFNIGIDASGKEMFFHGEVWRSPNHKGLPGGLCKACLAKAFKSASEMLSTMNDEDFNIV